MKKSRSSKSKPLRIGNAHPSHVRVPNRVAGSSTQKLASLGKNQRTALHHSTNEEMAAHIACKS
jgi:hypothetical protein